MSFDRRNTGNGLNLNDCNGDSDTTEPSPLLVVENGASNNRKKKLKRTKKRRNSKEVALVGWNRALPNLSMTHSLESDSSDVDYSQLPADLKAIGASGLSIFPREPQQQQQQSHSHSQQQQQEQEEQQPSTSTTATAMFLSSPTPPLLLSSSPSTSSSSSSTTTCYSPVLKADKTNNSDTAATTTTATTVTATPTSPPTATTTITTTTPPPTTATTTTGPTCTITTTATSTATSPKCNNNNISSTSIVGCPTLQTSPASEPEPEPLQPESEPEPELEPAPELEPEPESESETQTTDLSNQPPKPRRKRKAAKPNFPPEESSNASSTVSGMIHPNMNIKKKLQKVELQSETETETEVGPKTSPPSAKRMRQDEPNEQMKSDTDSFALDEKPIAMNNQQRRASDDFYRLPFQYGWKREIQLHSNSTMECLRGDISFISPAGKKCCSQDEIVPLLTGNLTIEHFYFEENLQKAGAEFEMVRKPPKSPQTQTQTQTVAKVELENKPVVVKESPKLKAKKEQPKPQPQLEQQQSTEQQQPQLLINKRTPGSGKRLSKPKVPRGASPPPEGWTSTMAVKANARVLAASNGNSGGGSGSSSHNSRKHSNLSKQSPKIQAATTTTTQPQSVQIQKIICLNCQQVIKDKRSAYPVGQTSPNNYYCGSCKRLTKKTYVPPSEVEQQEKDKAKEATIDENANANVNSNANSNSNAGNNNKFGVKEALDQQNGDSNGSMLAIAEEIELPGALPPDQLLSDDTPNTSATTNIGNKITPKPMEIVVINGRKALAIAGEPPRPRLQVAIREPDLELYEKHYHPKRILSAKEKRQSFVANISICNLSCQMMMAVMKTLDLHDRVRMSKVCTCWAMIARDRSVWRCLKLRDTHINNWLSCMREMVRNRTYELDMMGAKWSNPRLRMDGDMRVLRSLRILRTDPCESDFIQSVIKRLPRLIELRATCTSRVLNLMHIDKMTGLQVLRIRMTDPKASIVSLQPLQQLKNLKELSLLGINNMAPLDLLHLQQLQQLNTLLLGSCRGMKSEIFGEQVLPNLKNLRHLRLENHLNFRSFNIAKIMKGLSEGGTVKRLELINVNVEEDFSRQLSNCKSVEELLLMPNLFNNTANMMYYIMQAINENSEQLKIFRLGITTELLHVTSLVDKSLGKKCVTVVCPVPGVPETDKLNDSDENIAYLPVDRLESILHHMMPQAWLSVAKVPQNETTNLKFLPIDSGGTVNIQSRISNV